MISLQRITRQIGLNIFIRSFSSPAVSVATSASEKEKLPDLKKDNDNTPTAYASIASKNPIVAAAFASLIVEETPSDTSSDNKNTIVLHIDDLIERATTVNGLLKIAEKQVPITRKQAMKIVSVLSEWTTSDKIKLSDFETDAKFIKLCEILVGKNKKHEVQLKKHEKVTDPSKFQAFRTTDLNTVLAITGDDEAAKLIANITLPQMVKVMSALAQKKRRSTPLLRSLAYNISSSTDILNLKQCGDLLYAIAILNFPDPMLIGRICSDIQLLLPNNTNRPAVVGSIITSLGLLRYRDSDTLDILLNWVLQHHTICRPSDLASLFLTMATLNYIPPNMEEVQNTIVSSVCENDLQKSVDWLNVVWSFVVLECATVEHIESVLQETFFNKLVLERDGVLTPTLKMKLLNINAAGKLLFPEYKSMSVSEDHSIFEVPLAPSKEKQVLINGMLDALKSLLSSENYLKTNTDTKMGFVIEAECILNSKCIPLPFDSKTKDGKKIAIMVYDYFDMCQGSQQHETGLQALIRKLLEKSGYNVLTVPHTEFNIKDKLLKRVQYLEMKMKNIIGCVN